MALQRSGLHVKYEGCGKDITERSSICKNLEASKKLDVVGIKCKRWRMVRGKTLWIEL